MQTISITSRKPLDTLSATKPSTQRSFGGACETGIDLFAVPSLLANWKMPPRRPRLMQLAGEPRLMGAGCSPAIRIAEHRVGGMRAQMTRRLAAYPERQVRRCRRIPGRDDAHVVHSRPPRPRLPTHRITPLQDDTIRQCTSSSAGERPRAEAAPRDEGCKCEIDRVQHHEPELTKSAMGDHRADHEQNPADGSHRHQNRSDVEHGRQDQANRSQELEDAEGLDEADAGVLGPFPATMLGEFLLGYERLANAAD